MAATLAEDGVNKKRKISEDDSDKLSSSNVFKNFKLEKVLRDDPKHKLITVLGEFEKEGQNAVVLLERLPFDKTLISEVFSTEDGRTEETFRNDIYTTHAVFSSRTMADAKATMIYPATSKHIAKYSEHAVYIVRETPHLYATITKPCLQARQFSIQWVHNILEKKSEADRIVFEDSDPENGFILLPDMKWNRTDLDSLYLVAIIHKHGIHSLRDLTSQHLPLLNNILIKGKEAIRKEFSVPSSKLRIYFHYHPSYSHLHVHFTHVKFDAPGTDCLRAHTLEDVIDNLELDGDFYAKKMLMYTVAENDDLFEAYQSTGYFNE